MKVDHKEDYKDKRKVDYPPVQEQLDAIFKGGKAFDDMKKVIDDIKAKYPKPTP